MEQDTLQVVDTACTQVQSVNKLLTGEMPGLCRTDAVTWREGISLTARVGRRTEGGPLLLEIVNVTPGVAQIEKIPAGAVYWGKPVLEEYAKGTVLFSIDVSLDHERSQDNVLARSMNIVLAMQEALEQLRSRVPVTHVMDGLRECFGVTTTSIEV
ncbi:hypothetical protein JW766_03040 [Candidatus Dojkabacteria bacterium]|nr:hypothetical protein [Candidatus Dojkabacteria bacterium]